ncbi:MAG: hypothetical protein ACLSHC_10575 [Bilophila wadsworthia]
MKTPTRSPPLTRWACHPQLRPDPHIIDEELEAVWAGKKTAKQALDAAVERGNAELARFAKANKK